MNQLRQGDILLEATDIPKPQGLQPKEQVILAEGELTGHAHTLTGKLVYEWEMEGQRYVMVSGDEGTLYHEDHDPVPVRCVPADVTYRIIPQQEWDLSGQWRKVID